MLKPWGWPGHKGQGLLDVRVWECVSPQGPTAPLFPALVPPLPSSFPPAPFPPGEWWEGRCSRRWTGLASRDHSSAHPEPGCEGAGPVQSLCPAASSHKGLGTARSLAERRRMPGLLPWAVVPSPNLCFSAGLWGHPARLCRVPAVEEAQLPGQDETDRADWRVLGEDNPQAPGPGWTRAAPRAHGEGCVAVPGLPCSSPQPRAWSCILLPCPQARSPQGLFSRPLSPPCPLGC